MMAGIKEGALLIYCTVLCGVLMGLDKASLVCKFMYKKLHAAACALSQHVEKYRPRFDIK